MKINPQHQDAIFGYVTSTLFAVLVLIGTGSWALGGAAFIGMIVLIAKGQ